MSVHIILHEKNFTISEALKEASVNGVVGLELCD